MNKKEDEHEIQSKPGIRIVDRRRFDSAGDEKSEDLTSPRIPGAAVETVKPASETAAATINQKIPENPDYVTETNSQHAADFASSDFTMQEADAQSEYSDDPSEAGISFGSFVLSLATQAMMQLGQLKAPDGMAIPVDPVAAHQTIDILALLQEKTKGNLDPKEEGLLRDALHSLRLAFLKFR